MCIPSRAVFTMLLRVAGEGCIGFIYTLDVFMYFLRLVGGAGTIVGLNGLKYTSNKQC